MCNLLKNISIENPESMPTADAKKGEVDSFNQAAERFITPQGNCPGRRIRVIGTDELEPKNLNNKDLKQVGLQKTEPLKEIMNKDVSFNAFLEQNKSLVEQALQREYQAFQQKNALAAIEHLGLYTGDVCIAGVSVGPSGQRTPGI